MLEGKVALSFPATYSASAVKPAIATRGAADAEYSDAQRKEYIVHPSKQGELFGFKGFLAVAGQERLKPVKSIVTKCPFRYSFFDISKRISIVFNHWLQPVFSRCRMAV